ncbi:MAG: hypothetical protein NWE75_00845, partial [Candidatus Bathyarchaeota archaeon]|nr:hypothetical protein [Candidatus Bathyarchaeota archaeon]
ETGLGLIVCRARVGTRCLEGLEGGRKRMKKWLPSLERMFRSQGRSLPMNRFEKAEPRKAKNRARRRGRNCWRT